MPISAERLDQRRSRLLEVAEDLIREKGEAGFSMVDLAGRAGVSNSTPYNLIGSKSDVLASVITVVVQRFTDQLALLEVPDGLEGLLFTVDHAAKYWSEDAKFYKGLARALYQEDAPNYHVEVLHRGVRLWGPLVEKAIHAGDVVETNMSKEVIIDILVRQLISVLYDWGKESWSDERFRPQFNMAAHIALLPSASIAKRAQLEQAISRYAQSLSIQR